MTLKIKITSAEPANHRTDALGVVCFQGELEQGGLAALDRAFGGALAKHLESVEFTGKANQLVEVPSLGRVPAPRLLVCGAGERGDGEATRLEAALATVVRATLSTSPSAIAVVLPEKVASYRAVGEGVVLGAYRFTKYLTGDRRPKRELERIELLTTVQVSAAESRELELGRAIAEAICLTRDVVNEPPNVLYPETLVQRAREVAKKGNLKLKVLDPKALAAAGHALHVAVGQGSVHGPYLAHLSYTPRKPGKRIVFVGKGVTFDTGGICIKPMQGMADMKTDMAGAGAVLGLMAAVAALQPDVEVHGILGAAENMPDGNAYRPADVLASLSGKTVEIINTDAEGRLILADALTYATRLEPDAIIDAATLTGATLISLGQPYSAFFSNDEVLAEAMQRAARHAGESFWRMPLIEELATQLKSDVADLKHTGDRYGGAISAALFLREFVDQVPWIHCDIPGAVYADRPSGVYPKGATGHAVMTFLKLIESFSEGAEVSSKKAKPKTDGAAAPAAKKTPKKASGKRTRAPAGAKATSTKATRGRSTSGRTARRSTS
jgi:leucyl aminopeptidase